MPVAHAGNAAVNHLLVSMSVVHARDASVIAPIVSVSPLPREACSAVDATVRAQSSLDQDSSCNR